MVSVRLTEQLKRVKEVVKTWKEVDERVSQLCTTLLAQKFTSTGAACSADKITDGLVGFLSGNYSDDTLIDEYLGVNATVKRDGAHKATETLDKGANFRGVWAEWPVGRQGENQPYHFANYNFTLVATVSIDGEPRSGSVPLLGVRQNDETKTKLMELSYRKGKKWTLLCGDGPTKEYSSTWEKETKQHVVILLRNGNQSSAYVDGERVGEAPCQLEATDSKNISHFYIGGDEGSAGSQEGVSVMVMNVLLYNRPLPFFGGNADATKDITLPSGVVSHTAAGNQKTTVGAPATTQQVTAASNSHAVQRATGDAGTMRGSGLLPSLLLLGLWGFAAL
ncbi:trans-sialidase, putative [Trypanosoma cruzi marinkellei]|uniref:Trans-sialidase, putative n=1 Tax=Trypanosoma cruzi marinkellei TaxID=85056 RepID=K2MUG2_TRYCR|nr:trans-sialidase, putative [Trypanosoma cruzi marinkellei]